MATHEHTVVVEGPITTVYDQWTQFQSYPEFMDNVAEVEQVDDTMTHWKVSVAGVQREYDAQILEQRPSEVIAWRSVSGPEQAGRVSFSALDADRTRVTLRLDFEPHGLAERAAESFGVVASSVEGSLERFKDYIEARGTADGAWRGTVVDGIPLGASGSATRDPDVGWPAPGTDSPVELRDQDPNRPRSVGDVHDIP